MHVGYTVPGVVTGKPISLGGSEGRNEATGPRRGLHDRRRGAAPRHGPRQGHRRRPGLRQRRLDRRPAHARRGLHGHRRLRHAAAAIVKRDGLDIERVIGLEEGARDRRRLPGRRVHQQRASSSSCRLRRPHPGRPGEPDHGPQRRPGSRPRSSPRPPTARRRPTRTRSCTRNGVFMIPDILCNAGGVTVSYFEWVQDLNRDHWSEAIVNAKLKEIMDRSFAEVLAMAEHARRRHADGRLPRRRQAGRRHDRPARPLPVDRAPRPHRRWAPASAGAHLVPGGLHRRPGSAGPETAFAGVYHRGHARPRREVPVQGGDPPPRRRDVGLGASSTTSRTC